MTTLKKFHPLHPLPSFLSSAATANKPVHLIISVGQLIIAQVYTIQIPSVNSYPVTTKGKVPTLYSSQIPPTPPESLRQISTYLHRKATVFEPNQVIIPSLTPENPSTSIFGAHISRTVPHCPLPSVATPKKCGTKFVISPKKNAKIHLSSLSTSK